MADVTNISNISTYTTDDQQAIYNAYTLDADGDGKVDATYDTNGDGKVDDATLLTRIADDISAGTAPEGVNYEDLVSFYLDQTGELPPSGIPGPDQLGTDAWATDGALVETLNQWRVEKLDNAPLEAALQDLVYTNTGMDPSVVSDTQEFINDYYANKSAAEAAGTSTDLTDAPDLVTNMVSICLAFGNPGMALIAYIVGFDAKISEEDVEEDDGEDETIDGPMGTADPDQGATVDVVKNEGLGDVVKDLQSTAMDVVSDGGDKLDDLINDLRDIDPEDSEAQADQQEIQIQIDNVKTVITTMTEFIKQAQDILDSMLEAAASLNEKQSRTQSSIINKI
jgi:hypothetical protein